MWGPTQFISDIFADFVSLGDAMFSVCDGITYFFLMQYERMSIYETFLNGYPSTVVTLDSLYTKSATFSKFIDVRITHYALAECRPKVLIRFSALGLRIKSWKSFGERPIILLEKSNRSTFSLFTLCYSNDFGHRAIPP